MAKQAHYKPSGFTVVEVMIVLAIAGLIFGLIFAAIPALQRAGHNNSRHNDVANILNAYSHYELSNSGDNPPACGPLSLSPTVDCGATGEFLQYTNLSYYVKADITNYPSYGSDYGSNDIASNPETVYIGNYHVCGTKNGAPAALLQGAGYRDVVAVYSVETGGGNYAFQCEQL